MKKNTFVFHVAQCTVFLLIAASMTGCESTKATPLNEHTPIAVMTVYSNAQVPWDENAASQTNVTNTAVNQTDDGVFTGSLNRAIDKENPEILLAQNRIDDAAAVLFSTFEKNGLTTVEKEKITGSALYKAWMKNAMDYMNNTLPAAGYNTLQSANRKLNRTISKETGAGSVLYVSFRFEKQRVKDGVHDIGVRALTKMTVYAADSEGKNLFEKEYTATSTEYTDMHNAVWNRDKVCGYFHDTVESVVSQFMMDYASATDAVDETAATKEAVPLSIPSTVTQKANDDTSGTTIQATVQQ